MDNPNLESKTTINNSINNSSIKDMIVLLNLRIKIVSFKKKINN